MIVILLRLIARLYRMIDYQIYRTRVRILIARGLFIGKNVTLARSAFIDPAYPYLIRIGDNCSIAEHVRLLAHDAATFKFTDGHTRLGKIEIRDNCFIGDSSIILPGVTIGPNVLVAAGSVVTRDIPPNSCVAGIPARVYARFDDYIERNQQHIEEGCVFEFSALIDNLDRLDQQIKGKVWESLQDGRYAYVKGYTGRDPDTWHGDG
jgi:maltose O-acetyltransferase